MVPLRRHGDVVREDGTSAANELLIMGTHAGTHVDALAHVSYRGRLFGEVSTDEAQTMAGCIRRGIDELEPIVGRGILLDVAGAKGVEALPGAYGITGQDLADAERAAKLSVQAGDTVLVRTGWVLHLEDAQTFTGQSAGAPGVTEDAAHWLADRGVRATGADTVAYEQILPEIGHGRLPVHRELLVERGIPIVEMLDLEQLAADRVAEFLFVLAPLKIVGGTGSPVRPLAVVAA
jgi:kynurenine formamidase